MLTNKLIERFEEAVRADEVKGGGRPECYEEIEAEYEEAKAALKAEIERVRRPVWLNRVEVGK